MPVPPAAIAALLAEALKLHQAGRVAEAAAAYRRILAIEPKHADALQLLGVAAHQAGRNDEAIELIKRAIGLNRRVPHFHGNLGQVYRLTGRLDEAEASYRRALGLKPDYLDAVMGLAVLLQNQGKFEQAAAAYRRAVALNPDLAEAHNNLGSALEEQGKLAEAIESYERAVALKPGDQGMLYNLASALINAGETTRALAIARRGMQVAATDDMAALLGNCVKEVQSSSGDAELRALLARAIAEPWGRPQDFAAAAILLVREDPAIGSEDASLAAAAEDRLLQTLLENVLIGDVALERLLTRLRSEVLDRALDLGAVAPLDPRLIAFACALARQCFINEYVYAQAPEELAKVHQLRERVAAALGSGSDIGALALSALAAYLPLWRVDGAERLLGRTWPEDVAELLAQQIQEPIGERALAAALPALTPIADRISQLVRDQYETNPYPRWVKPMPAGRPTTVDEFLAKTFPQGPLRRLGKGSGIDILIAGCGTGQHSIETARLFAGARLLAIDLSRASLAYAKRQSEALGLGGIDYAQADILELGALGRSFDVIESSGVLHHLGDPFKGWEALLSLLRPAGLMRLGFYSEVARQDVVAARRFIAEHGFGDSADEIRRARQDMIAAGDNAPFASLTKVSDFFSTSACRDLLFHVQEHRLTLPQIAAFLADHRLALIGIEADAKIAQRYRAQFPGDRAMTDLGNWNRFETENPQTFRGMYQFWVQKAG